MKIIMITLQAGPDGVRKPGAVYDVPTAEAEELIAGGYAKKAAESAKAAPVGDGQPRTATRSRGRTATKPEPGEAGEPVSADEGEAPSG